MKKKVSTFYLQIFINHGAFLVAARFNYTCSGVRKSGERRSDVYYIDFDGMGPMEPVKALCELGRTVGEKQLLKQGLSTPYLV